MKRKSKCLLLLAFSMLIVGCSRSNTGVSSSIASEENNSSSIISSINNEESSSKISVSQESTISSSDSSILSEQSSNIESLSSEESITLTSLNEIRSMAYSLKDNVNSLNVAESNVKAKVSLKLLARFDMITTKNGMGDRYKLLMSDGKDYIYVKVNSSLYQKAETRINDVFMIEGTVSLYCGNPEITCGDSSFVASDVSIDVSNIFVSKTLKEAYSLLDDMSLNCKGCNGGELVTINAKYLAKMDNSVALFYDGTNIIQVHGKSNFMSSMDVGGVYSVSGALNMYNFKPGLEYYSSKGNSQVTINDIDKDSLEALNSEAYNVKYELDKNEKYPSYTNMFKTLRVVTGYVNYYIKDGKYYTVIEFENKDEVYQMYQNASAEKCLFLKNNSATNLASTKDVEANPFDEYFTGEEISVVVAPYLWNSNKYWQVYALEDTISLTNAK